MSQLIEKDSIGKNELSFNSQPDLRRKLRSLPLRKGYKNVK